MLSAGKLLRLIPGFIEDRAFCSGALTAGVCSIDGRAFYGLSPARELLRLMPGSIENIERAMACCLLGWLVACSGALTADARLRRESSVLWLIARSGALTADVGLHKEYRACYGLSPVRELLQLMSSFVENQACYGLSPTRELLRLMPGSIDSRDGNLSLK